MSISEDKLLDEAAAKYFGNKNKKGMTKEEHDLVINEQIPEHSSLEEMTAEGNIDTISGMADLLSKILNAAWGSSWGTIADACSRGDNPNKITFPLITYDTNYREVSPGTNLKPQQMNIKNEVINGKNTGDAYKIYRQFFDCIVEFDFHADTAIDTENLMFKFEEIMQTYAGYLKKQGIKELYFLKEIPAKYSLNYIEGVPMKCLLYYVQLERIHSVRLSTIRKIEETILLKNKAESKEDFAVNNTVYKEDK